MDDDLISRKELRKAFKESGYFTGPYLHWARLLIDIAPSVYRAVKNGTIEEEDSIITECRKDAIKKGLPLYFVYYEETGVFEVYVTKTKELFEKRHCSKELMLRYNFEALARQYLDDYSEWLGGQK